MKSIKLIYKPNLLEKRGRPPLPKLIVPIQNFPIPPPLRIVLGNPFERSFNVDLNT